MYPSSSKFSTRPSSPQFAKFSPPADYPLAGHHHSMSMRHPKSKGAAIPPSGSNNGIAMCSGVGVGVGGMVNSSTIGNHCELLFNDDIDSIEFCIPDNMVGNGCPGDSFTERRRRGHHSRRSNHKMEAEQQVKWTRKNIAATMERFEPASQIDYGEVSGMLTPTTTPQHLQHLQQLQMQHHQHQQQFQQQQQQQQHNLPVNHVYSYAYYEPGAAKCHTNVPHKEIAQAQSIVPVAGPSKSPPRNSIRALLAKSFRSKTLSHSASTSEERHTYTTRYGTTENLYEEVNDQKIRKVLSDNRIAPTATTVKEELRRVQHNHFRVLDELNLSLEALIMPPTPPDISPSTEEKVISSSSHVSLENLSSTLNSIELKDHTCINPEFDEGDLDSGFSGSGSSSGASYNESLRYYKTGTTSLMQTTTLPHNTRSCRSSTASGTSTSKSSMNSEDQGIGMMTTSSPFNYARRCSDSQRSSKSSVSGTKPKKSFWTIKP